MLSGMFPKIRFFAVLFNYTNYILISLMGYGLFAFIAVSGKIKKDIKVNKHDGFKCKQEESDTWDYRFSIYDGRRSDIKFDYSVR